jgi:predicted Zn-dependent peptidase
VRATLDNGLRVILAPDKTAPVVAVAVFYDVGFRSEPEGRTGFAHLFEHLMFQGSENVGKAQHPAYVQGAGGMFNGSTHPDYTNYFQLMPSGALELALFLEADRMRAPRLTQENLENQIAVVQEEIRVNVLNRPYGGFPWITLAPVAFDSFANAHNGYGDFSELEAATLEDAEKFFQSYYAPGNAVLSVAGDIDPTKTLALIDKHFGPIKSRRTPKRPSFAENVQPRREVLVDRLAPQPALAAGYPTPDPVRELPKYLATVVLAEVLSAGDASRLEQRLVQRDRAVTSVSTYLGTFGDPFDQRDPVLMTLEVHHPDGTSADQVLTAVDEEVDRLATDGLEPGELARVQARLSAGILREVDSVLERGLALAALEQQRGRAELVNELPGLLASVTEEQVRDAAGRLAPNSRAVLELRPGGAA